MYTLAKIVSVVHAGRDRLSQLVERCRETTTFILRPERKDSAPVGHTFSWSHWMATHVRRVADDTIGDVRVSTVFLVWIGS
jgi:hypothetical protein